MSSLRIEPEPESLAVALRRPATGLSLHWLGQAGFCIGIDGKLLLIDPYLSDALAAKYAGTALPHRRMMPAPIRADQLPSVDFVLITHRHGDHLDRPTLAIIAQQSPRCRFVAPAPETDRLLDLGIASERIMAADAGQALNWEGLSIHAIPAAHENLDRDSAGHHHYLGYVLSSRHGTLYHSGDCVPFAGLEDAISPFRIDLALLPVNGRDSYRDSMKIPGNFTLAEAVDLCRRLSIPAMIAHHFGMFDFNTLDRDQIETAATDNVGALQLVAAALHTRVVLDVAPGMAKAG